MARYFVSLDEPTPALRLIDTKTSRSFAVGDASGACHRRRRARAATSKGRNVPLDGQSLADTQDQAALTGGLHRPASLAGKSGRRSIIAQVFTPAPVPALPPSLLTSAQVVTLVERLVLDALPRRIGETRLADDLKITLPLLRYAFERERQESIYNALRLLRARAAYAALADDPHLSEEAAAYHFGFGNSGRLRQACHRLGETRLFDLRGAV
jgi:hypothetical protein